MEGRQSASLPAGLIGPESRDADAGPQGEEADEHLHQDMNLRMETYAPSRFYTET